MTDTVSDFLVDRADLHRTRVRTGNLLALADGDVLLSVDRFALTANNVTYAAFGDTMSYWDFFPSNEDGWGRIPAWGFATVVRSTVDGIAPGERFYGYYPMSTHLVVQPQHVGTSGFTDGSAHRAKLHALYNRYTRTTTDALYDPTREELTMLLRPLFVTSFVIDDFLADNAFFGARAVVLSSASSKTTYGTAWQLSLRRTGDANDGPEVVGLTSPGNVGFVERLGCYDRVTTYDRVASLSQDVPVVYVDFSGDRALRAALHAHFGDGLRYSCIVGSSHWDAPRTADASAPLPGAKPTFFFAPAQIAKRREEWGVEGFQQRFAAAWHGFTDRVVDAARPWITITAGHGPEAVERVYRDLLDGKARPDDGSVVSMHVA